MSAWEKSDRSDASDASDRSDKTSDGSDDLRTLLPKHGGYRKLRSFQVALAIYDATWVFCERFIEKRSRTHDQMVQAARSGVQNIAEGSMASATSKKTELKLTNVARSSLEELLRDCEDFLRQRSLPLWDKNSRQALQVRQRYKSDRSDASDASDLSELKTASPEAVANTLICLIHQATYLLGRQLRQLEQEFLEHGGFTERLYEMRSKVRAEAQASVCPLCGAKMVRRTARQGPHSGKTFWGCSAFPNCRGILSDV